LETQSNSQGLADKAGKFRRGRKYSIHPQRRGSSNIIWPREGEVKVTHAKRRKNAGSFFRIINQAGEHGGLKQRRKEPFVK